MLHTSNSGVTQRGSPLNWKRFHDFFNPFLSHRLHRLSLNVPLLLLLRQEAIDIYEGVRDDQALRMATNLGFTGALQRQVFTTHTSTDTT